MFLFCRLDSHKIQNMDITSVTNTARNTKITVTQAKQLCALISGGPMYHHLAINAATNRIANHVTPNGSLLKKATIGLEPDLLLVLVIVSSLFVVRCSLFVVRCSLFVVRDVGRIIVALVFGCVAQGTKLLSCATGDHWCFGAHTHILRPVP